jgi:dGTPase
VAIDLPKDGVDDSGSRRSARLRRITYRVIDHERQYPERTKSPDDRNQFETDRSRIIHSASFRRLQGKTQVFVVGKGDFYRTQLTHSLEVAQIAKGIAIRNGGHTDLVEAISLAHDLGHPPFGHSGEDELKKLMSEFGGFEANAQNVRLLTLIKKKTHEHDGLSLTRATLDGQLKYKVTFSTGAAKFCYDDGRDGLGDMGESNSDIPAS